MFFKKRSYTKVYEEDMCINEQRLKSLGSFHPPIDQRGKWATDLQSLSMRHAMMFND